jgi:hypothetical protein
MINAPEMAHNIIVILILTLKILINNLKKVSIKYILGCL